MTMFPAPADAPAAPASAPTPAPDGRAYGRLYLTVGAIFGLLMICLTPVGQVPDEPAHFWRTYQLCRGHVIGEKDGDVNSGGRLPLAVLQLAPLTARLTNGSNHKLSLAEVEAEWALRIDPDRTHRAFVDFHSYVVYSPVGYLPQYIGVKTAELFSDRLLALFYGARLCNLLAALLATYLTIRIAPCAHASICVLALCPETFMQMCSASADAFTNACAFLFFALFLRAAVRRAPLRAGGYLALLAPLLVVTQMKFPYVGLTLLLLAVPVAVYGSLWRRWAAVGGMGAACFVAYVGWYAAVRHLSMPGRPVPGISVPGQMAFIVHHPWQFLGTFGHALNQYGWENTRQFIGVFGWLDTPLPDPFFIGYGLFLLATWSLEVLPPALTTFPARGWAAAAAGWSLLMIFAFIYMYWNPVGSTDIEGFQGRYFIPLALALPLVLHLRGSQDWRDLRPRLAGTGLVCILGLSVTVLTVARRYYAL